jgi:hypothetical protein
MALKSPLSVRIERSGRPLGEAMNEIRSWLDDHKIEPADFRSVSSARGRAVFELRFEREDEARLFQQTFA